jgi:hypothetical protein
LLFIDIWQHSLHLGLYRRLRIRLSEGSAGSFGGGLHALHRHAG